MLPLFYKFHKKKKKKCLHLVGEGDLCPSLLFSRLKLNDDSSNFGWRPRQHQLCGTAQLYTWRNSILPKKKVPQTQNTPRNPKRERKMKKPIHTNQRAPNLSFISLSALKKKKKKVHGFVPYPHIPHRSELLGCRITTKGSNKFCLWAAKETLLPSVALGQELKLCSERPEERGTEWCEE